MTVREHETGYERTVVIGDIHGDLDTLLRSLAAKQVVRYDGEIDSVLRHIRTALKRGFSKNLESLLIRQEPRLQLIFLGDLVDRWPQGCHVIQFVSKVRWQRFGIDAVFLLGNHDMLDLHFFVNPYRIYEIYGESEFSLQTRMEFIGAMGLKDTLKGFLDLHRAEILALQREFYRTGVLEWDLGHGKLTIAYNRDLSMLLGYRGTSWEDLERYCNSRIRELGHEPLPESRNVLGDLVEHLGDYENPGGQNWWSIEPDPALRDRYHNGGYPWSIERFNLFYNHGDSSRFPPPGEGDDMHTYRNLLPVDWRVISLVWRRYYGGYFSRVAQIHRDGTTLFTHAGVSPQVMVDSQAFGVMFRPADDKFIDFEADQQFFSVDRAVERANRLARQVMINALNDYSFSCMSGAEITDMMGVWRGGRRGFTQFGGVYWADCDYLQHELRHSERLVELYRKFLEVIPITRVVCGHTRFSEYPEAGTRYQRIDQLADELGLDYLCVDNSCSRGYRREPVLNGIEIDADGQIPDPGKAWPKW